MHLLGYLYISKSQRASLRNPHYLGKEYGACLSLLKSLNHRDDYDYLQSQKLQSEVSVLHCRKNLSGPESPQHLYDQFHEELRVLVPLFQTF